MTYNDTYGKNGLKKNKKENLTTRNLYILNKWLQNT